MNLIAQRILTLTASSMIKKESSIMSQLAIPEDGRFAVISAHHYDDQIM